MNIDVIVPCRNEAAQIEQTLASIEIAAAVVMARELDVRVSVFVVANGCTDGTHALVDRVSARASIPIRRLGSCARNAPSARNEGARAARGDVLVFLDADTQLGPEALRAVLVHVRTGKQAGICAFAPQSQDVRARAFFFFWNQVRRLPLPKAKAMPAFMFVTREAFGRFGPFDEDVLIGEEWPILAGVYRADPSRLSYDRDQVAYTSSRRMDLQPFGYTRVLARYVWAVLHPSGRVHYPDHVREEAP